MILSHDPIVIPATEEKIYGYMKMSDFRARLIDGQTHLRVRMTNSDEKENLSSEGRRVIHIEDLEAQMAVTPKLKAAWDAINNVMDLYYDFHTLRDKVNEAIGRGEDATKLIESRDTALAELRAK